MHLLSLDLETTGLDPLTDQILEIGCVATDLTDRFHARHEFRRLVTHSAYQGNAFALAMNSAILYEIAEAEKKKEETGTTVIVTLEELAITVGEWIVGLPFYGNAEKLTLTGKNVGSFDLAFLRMIPGWNSHHKVMKIGHRCLDPGPLYAYPGDAAMPDLKTCMMRAGIEKQVKHRSLDDAHAVLDVIKAAMFPVLHLKSGDTYHLRSQRVVDATNGTANGRVMTLYQNSDGDLFVRERDEFSEKFTWNS